MGSLGPSGFPSWRPQTRLGLQTAARITLKESWEGDLGAPPGWGHPWEKKQRRRNPLRLGHPIPILAWELPGPLSACLCLPVALSLAHSNLRYFLLSRFHQEPAWLTLALRPRESQARGAQHQLWFSLPPTLGNVDGARGVLMGEFQGPVTIGCRPTSSPGIASLGSAPLGGSRSEHEERVEEAGAPRGHPGHPLSPETGRPKVTGQP